MTSQYLLEGDLTPELLHEYLQSSSIAVDTETMGLNPHRDRLCLVQLYDERGNAYMVRIQGPKAPYLKELLENEAIVKVFHYARFDVMMLQKHLGIQVKNIYCTKIASKLARTYSPKHGLKDVVQEIAGIELDKTSQTSNWSKSELTASQIQYALNDVRYLIQVMKELNAMLEREERLDLLTECLQVIPTLCKLELLGWSESVFGHH